MKIYKLSVSDVEPITGPVFSSYIAPRHERSSEYFVDKEKASKRQAEIYEGAKALLGYIPNIEVRISEIEVCE